MKSEIDSDNKRASIEGTIVSVSSSGYESCSDVDFDNGSDYGTSLARWIEDLPFVKKGSKIRVIVMEVKE